MTPSTATSRFDAVVAAFAADRAVTRGRMFGAEGLKVNGKVFAMLVKGALVVKLPASRVAKLLQSGQAEPFDPGHGRPMKEWVRIPGAKPAWPSVAREAHEFVGSAGTPSRTQ